MAGWPNGATQVELQLYRATALWASYGTAAQTLCPSAVHVRSVRHTIADTCSARSLARSVTEQSRAPSARWVRYGCRHVLTLPLPPDATAAAMT